MNETTIEAPKAPGQSFRNVQPAVAVQRLLTTTTTFVLSFPSLQDILDVATIKSREAEPSRPFREVLKKLGTNG